MPKLMLTELEQQILELTAKDLSDYKIARKLHRNPSTIARSRKNAIKKLRRADADLTWAKQIEVSPGKLSEESIRSSERRRV